MNIVRTVTTVARRAPQLQATAAPARKYKTLAQIKELQKQFSVYDGVPVYLKGGSFDVALYKTTLVASGLAVVYCFYTIYGMIYKHKK
uniref:Putative cytochrome c oxidase subunit viia 2 n=1 Tax=Amblyomma aureolatum TaxID=187763 RepID=A0A1E1WYM6_9ACAR